MRVLLIIYDNDSFLHWFPQGSAYIAAALKKAGHTVTIYSQDINHYTEEHLTAYLNENVFDVIGLGIIAGYYQYAKLLKLSAAIAQSTNRAGALYVLGGHGPAPEPEYFLEKTGADIVVMGEGEETIIELIDAIGAKRPLNAVRGIAYKENGQLIITEKRSLIADVDSITWPAYELFPVSIYRLFRFPGTSNCDFVMPVLSGRGCKFTCNFCYRIDEGFRPRGAAGIIEEIRFLKKNYGITYIIFSDELFMSSAHRAVELSEAFIRAELNIKWWCNGRLNFATAEVLQTMKKAGCVFINYGIESYDDDMLRVMNKALTVKQIDKGIEETVKQGIIPGLNLIFGNINETEAILDKGVDFLLKYTNLSEPRTIRPVTPYPGSPLYYYALENNLLQDVADFYENKHLNSDLVSVNFTDLSLDEYYQALIKANTRLLDDFYEKKKGLVLESVKRLYTDRDAGFRGFRHT